MATHFVTTQFIRCILLSMESSSANITMGGHAYLLNPFIYMIEGMRSAATGNPIYISLPVCIAMQLTLIVVFIVLLLFAVRKRIDPLV